MMKLSSQLALLLLYSPQTKNISFVSRQNISEILSQMGYSSLNSLWYILEKKKLIINQNTSHGWQIGLTHAGRAQLEHLFPAFWNDWAQWDGSWSCMVFVNPPASDKNFRYLRTKLIESRCLPLARGVYAYPKPFSSSVLREIIQDYQQSVLCFSVKEFEVGSFEQGIFLHYGLSDCVEAYSAVSKEISALLALLNDEKIPINRIKSRFSLLLENYHAVLQQDAGICGFYFPHSPQALIISKELHALIKHLG